MKSATVLVPPGRWERWLTNFESRHGSALLTMVDGRLRGQAQDGSTFVAALPFDCEYAGPPDPAAFVAAAAPPDDWGVVLVRKGGFAVARLAGSVVGLSKVGQRHVQGRTKAGGQSQQRFARRRDNQARVAYEAAADHAARILEIAAGGDGRLPVVCGGDRSAVSEVLSDPRLAHLSPTDRWLAVPDPRRAVLEAAVEESLALTVDVVNAPT